MSAPEVTPIRNPLAEYLSIRRVRGGYIVAYTDKTQQGDSPLDYGKRIELVAPNIDGAFALVAEILDPADRIRS